MGVRSDGAIMLTVPLNIEGVRGEATVAFRDLSEAVALRDSLTASIEAVLSKRS